MSGKPNKAWERTMIDQLGSKRALSDHMKKIGAKGGRISRGGGFAVMAPCFCDVIDGEHHRGQCAGKKGGLPSRRGAAQARDLQVASPLAPVTDENQRT